MAISKKTLQRRHPDMIWSPDILDGRKVLRRQIARKFGDDTAGQLSELLDDLTGIDNIDRVTDALLECGTDEEFIERVRMA